MPRSLRVGFSSTKIEAQIILLAEPDELEEIIAEPADLGVDTTQVVVKTSIDGNVENESNTMTILPAPAKIKINITKTFIAPKEQENSKEKETKVESDPVTEETDTELVPASIKSDLQGRELSILPLVKRGEELSGLCSIM